MNHSATTIKKVGDASCGLAMLDFVDEHDNVIGQATFDECLSKGLLRRGAGVLVFTDAALTKLVVQKRSATLMIDPNKLTTSASGHLDAGESYDAAALRELHEELFHGREMPALSLNLIRKFSLEEGPRRSAFVALYYTVHPGPFFPDPAEIESISIVELEGLRKDMKAHPEKYWVGLVKEIGLFDEWMAKRGARR